MKRERQNLGIAACPLRSLCSPPVPTLDAFKSVCFSEGVGPQPRGPVCCLSIFHVGLSAPSCFSDGALGFHTLRVILLTPSPRKAPFIKLQLYQQAQERN